MLSTHARLSLSLSAILLSAAGPNAAAADLPPAPQRPPGAVADIPSGDLGESPPAPPRAAAAGSGARETGPDPERNAETNRKKKKEKEQKRRGDDGADVSHRDSHRDCEASRACRVGGACTAHRGRCVATSERQCGRSADCAAHDRCALDPEQMTCVERTAQRTSRGLMAVGIVAIAAGGLALLSGSALLVTDPRSDLDMPLMIGGGIGVAVGIPATVIGARNVESPPSLEPDPRYPPAGLAPIAGIALGWKL